MTDVEVERVDAPIRVELSGSIGGGRAARICVGQLSIGYKDGRVIVWHKDLQISVWPAGDESAQFAAGGHSAVPVMVEAEPPTPSAEPPLVRMGPGGDFVRDYPDTRRDSASTEPANG